MRQPNFTFYSLQAAPSGAVRVVTESAEELRDKLLCDDTKMEKYAPLPMYILVLGNVVGGSLLLSGMLMLPHFLAGLLN